MPDLTLLDQIEHMKFAHTRCPASCHLYHHEVMTLCAKLREVVEAVQQYRRERLAPVKDFVMLHQLQQQVWDALTPMPET